MKGAWADGTEHTVPVLVVDASLEHSEAEWQAVKPWITAPNSTLVVTPPPAQIAHKFDSKIVPLLRLMGEPLAWKIHDRRVNWDSERVRQELRRVFQRSVCSLEEAAPGKREKQCVLKIPMSVASTWRYMVARPSGLSLPRGKRLRLATKTSLSVVCNAPDPRTGANTKVKWLARKLKSSSSVKPAVVVTQ